MALPIWFKTHLPFRNRFIFRDFELRPAEGLHPSLTYRAPFYIRYFKPVMIGVLGTLAVLVLYVIYWFFMATHLREGVVAWGAARRAEGYTVEYSKLMAGGFPFHFRLVTDAPRLASPASAAEPWAWSGGGLRGETAFWSPWRVALTPWGPQRLDLTVGGKPVAFQGQAERLSVVVDFSDPWPMVEELTVRALNLDAGKAGAIRMAVGDMIASRNLDKKASTDTETFSVQATVEGLELPDATSLPFGPRAERLLLDVKVMGPILELPLVERLVVWRDAGGTLDISRIGLDYGPVSLRANGTMALDGDMQPAGAFTARIKGFNEAIELLRRNGLIRSRDALTARIVLGALAQRPDDGGAPVLSIPLTLQERKIYAGPVLLTEFPVVRWGNKGDSIQ